MTTIATVMLLTTLNGQPLTKPDWEMCDELMGSMAMGYTEQGWRVGPSDWDSKTRHYEILTKGKKEVELACDGLKITTEERDRQPRNSVCVAGGECSK